MRFLKNGFLLLGFALIILGVLLMTLIVPKLALFPADLEARREYQLDYLTLLNAENLSFFIAAPDENPNLVIDRLVKVEAVEGQAMLVREDQRVMNGEESLYEVTYYYALDRKTLLAAEDFPAEWRDHAGFWERDGLVISWPLDTQKQDYRGWAEDYRASVPLEFVREENYHGIDTYYFTSESAAQALVIPHVETLGMPQSLTPLQLATIAGSVEVEGIEVTPSGRIRLLNLIRAAVAATQENVDVIPLVYEYDYRGEYWIEPVTGTVIDTVKYEHRAATFPQEVLAHVQNELENSDIATDAVDYLPADILERLMPITVNEFVYRATPDTLTETIDEANDFKNQMRLFGTYLPLGLIGVGLGLLLAWAVVKKRGISA